MPYAIAMPHHRNRPNFYDGGKAEVEWIPDLSLGTFETNVDAKRHFLFAMKELSGSPDHYSDDFIRRSFKMFQNLEAAKIVKIPDGVQPNPV